MEFYTKAFFVALAALVLYGLLLVLQPFAGSMAWAAFLAFLLVRTPLANAGDPNEPAPPVAMM